MPFPWGAIGACLLPNVGGWVGGLITRPAIKTWYKDLKVAPWNPPKWAFGPVWTILYTSMGYASYLVYRDGSGFSGEAAGPLTVYGVQLALNWLWTPIFFGCARFKLALAEILLLDAAAVACTYSFSTVNQTAALLLLPYLGWLSIATSLNAYVAKFNEDCPQTRKREM